ncbi:hypothetical protein AAMO2058_000014400 [Amorphochlora amoebiformis]
MEGNAGLRTVRQRMLQLLLDITDEEIADNPQNIAQILRAHSLFSLAPKSSKKEQDGGVGALASRWITRLRNSLESSDFALSLASAYLLNCHLERMPAAWITGNASKWVSNILTRFKKLEGRATPQDQRFAMMCARCLSTAVVRACGGGKRGGGEILTSVVPKLLPYLIQRLSIGGSDSAAVGGILHNLALALGSSLKPFANQIETACLSLLFHAPSESSTHATLDPRPLLIDAYFSIHPRDGPTHLLNKCVQTLLTLTQPTTIEGKDISPSNPHTPSLTLPPPSNPKASPLERAIDRARKLNIVLSLVHSCILRANSLPLKSLLPALREVCASTWMSGGSTWNGLGEVVGQSAMEAMGAVVRAAGRRVLPYLPVVVGVIQEGLAITKSTREHPFGDDFLREEVFKVCGICIAELGPSAKSILNLLVPHAMHDLKAIVTNIFQANSPSSDGERTEGNVNGGDSKAVGGATKRRRRGNKRERMQANLLDGIGGAEASDPRLDQRWKAAAAGAMALECAFGCEAALMLPLDTRVTVDLNLAQILLSTSPPTLLNTPPPTLLARLPHPSSFAAKAPRHTLEILRSYLLKALTGSVTCPLPVRGRVRSPVAPLALQLCVSSSRERARVVRDAAKRGMNIIKSAMAVARRAPDVSRDILVRFENAYRTICKGLEREVEASQMDLEHQEPIPAISSTQTPLPGKLSDEMEEKVGNENTHEEKEVEEKETNGQIMVHLTQCESRLSEMVKHHQALNTALQTTLQTALELQKEVGARSRTGLTYQRPASPIPTTDGKSTNQPEVDPISAANSPSHSRKRPRSDKRVKGREVGSAEMEPGGLEDSKEAMVQDSSLVTEGDIKDAFREEGVEDQDEGDEGPGEDIGISIDVSGGPDEGDTGRLWTV